MSTDMAVLEQACRNVRGIYWSGDSEHGWFDSINIRTEYHRLLRLKKRKKAWKSERRAA